MATKRTHKSKDQVLYYAKPLLQLLIALAIILSFFMATSQAATISRKKGKKVAISISEGDNIQRRKLYYIVNSSGRKKGILRVVKVKGKIAYGVVLKGRAQKGWSLQERQKKSAKANTPEPTQEPKGKSWYQGKNIYWGFIAGQYSNSMDVKSTTDSSVTTLSGSSLGYAGFFDYPLFNSFLGTTSYGFT